MYNFTVLACQLNEPEDGVAPTDSRFRPDQRLMEEGNLDEANIVKVQLEEKQRQVSNRCIDNSKKTTGGKMGPNTSLILKTHDFDRLCI